MQTNYYCYRITQECKFIFCKCQVCVCGMCLDNEGQLVRCLYFVLSVYSWNCDKLGTTRIETGTLNETTTFVLDTFRDNFVVFNPSVTSPKFWSNCSCTYIEKEWEQNNIFVVPDDVYPIATVLLKKVFRMRKRYDVRLPPQKKSQLWHNLCSHQLHSIKNEPFINK